MVEPLVAFGPAPADHPRPTVAIISPIAPIGGWRSRYSWRRYLQGAAQLETDRSFGKWLATRIGPQFHSCYVFTQLALELLADLKSRGTPHVLDNPNGHIRHFRDAVQSEAERWLCTRYPGHPTPGMVDRVEEEYSQAARIRVASQWAAASLRARGVPADRITVIGHVVDLRRFVPRSDRSADDHNALRIVFVGRMALAKGFHHLLAAVRRLRTQRISITFVGDTGDPWCKRLFRNLSMGLDVTVAPGDPVAAYQQSDVLVLPTLHDGFGLVVAEAMACGIPVITTDQCGAAECLRQGESGWIVPAADIDALAAAIENATQRRRELRAMGEAARRDIEVHCGPATSSALRHFVAEHLATLR